MFPVPSYQLIPFLAWLSERGMRSLAALKDDQLRSLAARFLQEPRAPRFDSLVGIMTVFQYCPMIRERTIEEQMRHFSRCGRCIDYMDHHEGSTRIPQPRYDIRKATLHPLIDDFVQWSAGSEFEAHLKESGCSETSSGEFRRVIDQVGDELREQFQRYLTESRPRSGETVENFLRWRQAPEEHNTISAKLRDRDEEDTRPLGSQETFREATARLAASVRVAINSGFYDRHIAEVPQIARFMCVPTDTSENLVQTLEFLNYVRGQEPGLSLTGNIPATELEKLAQQFCEERGYSNGLSFSKEVKRSLSGAGSAGVLDRIARFLGLRRGPKLPDGRPAPHNLLDRYGAVQFHGLFLFMSSGNFPAFLETHWRDLHHLTGNDLDVYFSDKDLSERISGYEIVGQLRSVQPRPDEVPAILLWEDKLEASVVIPLHGIEHHEIVDVMKTIMQGIRDGCTLDVIAARGVARATAWQNKSERGNNFNLGPGAVLQFGDQIMNGDNVEKKQVGDIVGGDKHVGDVIGGDKVGRDKGGGDIVRGNKVVGSGVGGNYAGRDYSGGNVGGREGAEAGTSDEGAQRAVAEAGRLLEEVRKINQVLSNPAVRFPDVEKLLASINEIGANAREANEVAKKLHELAEDEWVKNTQAQLTNQWGRLPDVVGGALVSTALKELFSHLIGK